MTSSNSWSDDGDGWSLGLEGFMVTKISVDDAVTLHCTNGRESRALALEGPFRLHRLGDEHSEAVVELIPDGEPSDLAPALSLLLGSIRHAHLGSGGVLDLQLTDGRRITVHAEESFCSWRLMSGSETIMMSMPENYAGARRSPLP